MVKFYAEKPIDLLSRFNKKIWLLRADNSKNIEGDDIDFKVRISTLHPPFLICGTTQIWRYYVANK